MAEGTKISFVTWPDGKVDGNSLTLFGARLAKEAFIAGWLPEQVFGTPSLGYSAFQLWHCAAEKGFRCHTIEIAADGKPTLERA